MNGHVCQALDFMHLHRRALVDRYELLGASERSTGSFGVVQLATVQRMSVRPVPCQPPHLHSLNSFEAGILLYHCQLVQALATVSLVKGNCKCCHAVGSLSATVFVHRFKYEIYSSASRCTGLDGRS